MDRTVVHDHSQDPDVGAICCLAQVALLSCTRLWVCTSSVPCTFITRAALVLTTAVKIQNGSVITRVPPCAAFYSHIDLPSCLSPQPRQPLIWSPLPYAVISSMLHRWNHAARALGLAIFTPGRGLYSVLGMLLLAGP